MNARFSGNNHGFRRRNEKERLFFIAAAGLAFSLLIITLVVLDFKTEANARMDTQTPVENPAPRSLGMVTLYAPERVVPAGSRLSDVKLKEVYWSQDQLPEGAIRDLSEIKSMYATEALKAAVPLQRSMLSPDQIQRSLPVTPGNRAVTIQVDAISGLEGHITPGSRVDIALTYYEGGNLTTKIIVQNARVLSYGGVSRTNTQFVEGPRVVGSSVTLDVAPEDALRILTSKKLGSLNLTMRADVDGKTVKETELRDIDIEGNKRKPSVSVSQAASCGRAKIGGVEYVMPCDASQSLTKLDSENP